MICTQYGYPQNVGAETFILTTAKMLNRFDYIFFGRHGTLVLPHTWISVSTKINNSPTQMGITLSWQPYIKKVPFH